MQRRHGTGDHFSQDGNAYICHANTQYAGRDEPPETHCLVYNNEYLTYQELVNENWGSITTIRVKPE